MLPKINSQRSFSGEQGEEAEECLRLMDTRSSTPGQERAANPKPRAGKLGTRLSRSGSIAVASPSSNGTAFQTSSLCGPAVAPRGVQFSPGEQTATKPK